MSKTKEEIPSSMNLAAMVNGFKITPYQHSLAKKEYMALLNHCKAMDSKIDTPICNIPQLKVAVNEMIEGKKEMLKGEIRTVGLKEKIVKRIITLTEVQLILNSHKD